MQGTQGETQATRDKQGYWASACSLQQRATNSLCAPERKTEQRGELVNTQIWVEILILPNSILFPLQCHPPWGKEESHTLENSSHWGQCCSQLPWKMRDLNVLPMSWESAQKCNDSLPAAVKNINYVIIKRYLNHAVQQLMLQNDLKDHTELLESFLHTPCDDHEATGAHWRSCADTVFVVVWNAALSSKSKGAQRTHMKRVQYPEQLTWALLPVWHGAATGTNAINIWGKFGKSARILWLTWKDSFRTLMCQICIKTTQNGQIRG